VGPDPTLRDPPARAANRLRVILGLGTLAMLGLSWPLWVEPTAFPRVPFVAGFPPLPAPAAWAVFGVALGAIASATAGIAWRKCLALSVVLLGLLLLGDQHRFQAWIYQFGMVALLLAALPNTQALALARWWYVATYGYSGVSKLDVAFCRELGASLLDTACSVLGADCRRWPSTARTHAILAMPAWELVVALLLSVPATRRIGRVGAVLIHGTLVLILGPWGMNHSTIVQVWNAVTAIEVWIVFGPGLASSREPARVEGTSIAGWAVRGLFLVGVLLPLGEPWGYCDAWPAHALYASHVERTEVFLHEDQIGSYPPVVQRYTDSGGPRGGPWRRLDLTGWSRAVRGVPVYPQARACNGLAEALAARYGEHDLIRVVQSGRADRWTGRRKQVSLLGLAAIRNHAARYLLNAHPARQWGQEEPSMQAARSRRGD
jgi:hypothetical protein